MRKITIILFILYFILAFSLFKIVEAYFDSKDLNSKDIAEIKSDKINDDKPSSFDWIKPEDIDVYSGHTVIDTIRLRNNFTYFTKQCNIKGTGSMLPMFTKNHCLLLFKPDSIDDIHIGDIIIYCCILPEKKGL
mgnify:CR=1 FL=1